MAIYQLSYYGQDFYGLSGVGVRAGRGFSVAPLTAEPTHYPREEKLGPGRYDQMYVAWERPAANDWKRLVLVRTFSGFPSNVLDGETLLEVPFNDKLTRDFIDTEIVGGQTGYYTVFVQADDDVWFRGGDARQLAVRDYGFERLLEFALPDAVLRADFNTTEHLDPPLRNPMRRLVASLGFELARVRTEYETLNHLYNPLMTPSPALSPLMEMFGMNPHPAIDSRSRTLVRNLSFLADTKGSVRNIEALASLITGWGATVSSGKNLMLSSDGAHYDVFFGGVLSPGDGTGDYTSVDWAFLEDVGEVDGDISASPTPARLVAVEEGVDYTFTTELQGESSGADGQLVMVWYDEDLVEISSSSTAVSPFVANDTWTTFELNAAAPAGAVWVDAQVHFNNLTGTDNYYVRHQQLEAAATFTSYEEPRAIVVSLAPAYINAFTTPSFTTGVTPAVTSDLGSHNVTTEHARVGTTSLEVVPTVSGAEVNGDDQVGCSVGDPVTVRTSLFALDAVRVDVGVKFRNEAGDVIATERDAVTTQARVWLDLTSRFTAPPNAASAAWSLRVPANETVFVDRVLLAQAWGSEYFDGSSFVGETEWAGAAHESASYYYPLRSARHSRLILELENFLPYNRTAVIEFEPVTP